jgi:hypothetical protein
MELTYTPQPVRNGTAFGGLKSSPSTPSNLIGTWVDVPYGFWDVVGHTFAADEYFIIGASGDRVRVRPEDCRITAALGNLVFIRMIAEYPISVRVQAEYLPVLKSLGLVDDRVTVTDPVVVGNGTDRDREQTAPGPIQSFIEGSTKPIADTLNATTKLLVVGSVVALGVYFFVLKKV